MDGRQSKAVDLNTPDAVIVERARSLANDAMWTIALQRRRLRTIEPEDSTFAFRWWADLQFLIVSLRRLRRAVELAGCATSTRDSITAALKTFDAVLPCLLTLRNVGEHIDDYAVDSPNRRNKQITRKMLQAGTWDGTTFEWLAGRLNVDVAHDAAFKLVLALRNTPDQGQSDETLPA